MNTLHDKTLVMIVGPSAVGKSTLMHEVIKRDPQSGYVRSFTSRKPRPNEQAPYEFITKDEATQLHGNGKTITYFEFPGTGDAYGTTIDSFRSTYNLLDTLSVSVETYRSLPFHHTITVSLTTDPENWFTWFTARFPTKSPDAMNRLKEARDSIKWSLADDQTYWLTNSPNDIEKTADELISIVHTFPRRSSPPRQAEEMLARIERELV